MFTDPIAYTWRGHLRTTEGYNSALARARLVVKDIFHIEGLPTGFGNPDWLNSHPIPQATADAVAALLDAGAALLGKTLSDELAYSLNGSNVHYGTPTNPAAPERFPGGSSVGSATAVAAGEADIGLGSDTGGSIRVPASYTGLYGLRTTHGLVSTKGMLPLAPLFDTVGWVASEPYYLGAAGNALLPSSVPETTGTEQYAVTLIEPQLEHSGLWSEAHEQWLLEQSEFRVVRRLPISAEWLERASECFRVLQGRAIWRSHGHWVESTQPRIATDIAQRLEWCKSLSERQEQDAAQERLRLQSDIENWFREVDVVVLPTTPGPAPLLDSDPNWMNKYRKHLMGLTSPAGLAGLPQLQIPAIRIDEAPVGMSVLGKAKADRILLDIAMQSRPSEYALS